MKFTNISDDARIVTALRFTVEPGAQTPDLTPEESAGFAGQTEVWAAVTPAKTSVASAPAEVMAAPVADEGKA